MSVVTKRLDGSRCHLIRKQASASAPPKRGTALPLFGHVCCGQTVAHLSKCWAWARWFGIDVAAAAAGRHSSHDDHTQTAGNRVNIASRQSAQNRSHVVVVVFSTRPTVTLAAVRPTSSAAANLAVWRSNCAVAELQGWRRFSQASIWRRGLTPTGKIATLAVNYLQ